MDELDRTTPQIKRVSLCVFCNAVSFITLKSYKCPLLSMCSMSYSGISGQKEKESERLKLLLIAHRLLASYKTHWINLMLDKITVEVGQPVTMDTVQIMIFLVTLVLTYERTILHTTTDFFYLCFCVLLSLIV